MTVLATWQGGLQVAGALVSALAAVAALVFAYLTVRQTRDLRREDRLARLGELVGDYGEALLRAMNAVAYAQNTTLPIARARLQASIAGAGEPLPACEVLLAIDYPTDRSIADVTEAVTAASVELAQLVAAT